MKYAMCLISSRTVQFYFRTCLLETIASNEPLLLKKGSTVFIIELFKTGFRLFGYVPHYTRTQQIHGEQSRTDKTAVYKIHLDNQLHTKIDYYSPRHLL